MKLQRIRGVITAKEFSGNSIDVPIQDTRGRLVTLQYSFPSGDIRRNMYTSLKDGTPIEGYLAGPFNRMRVAYKGVGVITIIDPLELTPQWDDVDHDLFPTAELNPEDDREFTDDELRAIRALTNRAKRAIHETFSPPPEIQAKIDRHLDQLARDSRETTAFDWKRLFVTTVVSIATDLGFGATVPEVLVNLFKLVLSEFAQYHLLLEGRKD
jgi:hypothetical protein